VLSLTQGFGGPWTLIKLEMLQRYLGFYTTALKKQNFNLCYIDAFAGSGNVDLKTEQSVTGSALRALDYPFDRYIFIEHDESYLAELSNKSGEKAPGKRIDFFLGDCNEMLKSIYTYNWRANNWRGVIFLDPYAMNLRWESLKTIAQSEAFDVWYLFPLSALIRCLPKEGRIPNSWQEKINALLGTHEWQKELYHAPAQLSLFDDERVERVEVEDIKAYVIKRLRTIFPGVSPSPAVLRQSKNAPMFLLCFAISNPSHRAIQLSLKGADHILKYKS